MTPDQDLSAATADLTKSKPEPHWPVGLYAPGNYICICADCGKQHIAAKRALHCADCTIQRLFNRIANDADKIKAMAADHTAAVQAAVAKAVEAALREHTGREETGESITEKYLRRYPRSKKTRAWEGTMVHLRTQNGIWRPDGHGYTLHFAEAWVLPLADARNIVFGIYEDHGGTYYRASAAAIRSRGVAG